MDYAMATTSIAHTYGNVTAFMTEYIKQLFPKDYFRTIHISSTIAYRQFNVLQNTTKEFLKKNKPMLIIKPRVELSDTDNFLFGTMLTQRITDNYHDLDMGNLQEFFRDTKNGTYIKYLLNRVKMFFDVTIVVESQMEQLNQAMYIKNRVRQEHNFYLQTALESYVPKPLLGILAKDIDIPMYDENNNVKPFLDYVNAHSYYPVTYKLKTSSGLDEFFRYYPINIDTTVTGLSMDDGSKKGFINDTYTVTFSVSTEFNTSGLYYYFTQKPELLLGIDMNMELGSAKQIIPIFTVTNLFDIQLPDGWNTYSSVLYKVESDDSPDVTDLSQVFNTSLLEVIKYHVEKGVPLGTFLNVIVMKDNVRLSEVDRDYVINYETLKLITNRVNTVSTYRLIINVNTLYVNELIKDVYNFK